MVNSRNRIWLVLAVLALGAGTQSFAANEPTYDYVDVGYVASDELDGISVHGAASLAGAWHIEAAASSVEGDGHLVEGRVFEAAAGYHWRWTPSTHLIVNLGLTQENETIDTAAGDVEEAARGPLIGIGLRSHLYRWLEVQARVSRLVFSGNSLDDKTVYALGADIYLTPGVAFTLGVLDSAEAEPMIRAGLRFQTRTDR